MNTPATALTKTQATTIATHTGGVDGNEMRSSSWIWTDPQCDHSAAVTSARRETGIARTTDHSVLHNSAVLFV
jgi:hypothetical protein